ncbi:MAG: hypothetical protein HQL69_19510 [Magnetococcales bacterium]|nr:hypothetical protein [Magnetococcales bacterium]
MYKNRLLAACLLTMFTTQAKAVEIGPLEVHGFLSQGYMHSSEYDFLADSDGGTARFNEFGVNFMYDLSDNLRGGMQVVSRDMGFLEDNSPMIDWAFADYHYNDLLGLRVGKVKVPLGIYNNVLDIDAARSQIIPPMSLYNFYLRDLTIAIVGGSVYGNISLDDFGDADYTAYIGNVPIETGKSFEGMLQLTSGSTLDEVENSISSGINVKWNSPYGLMLNASYVDINDIEFAGTDIATSIPYESKMEMYAYSLGAEYVWNDLTFTTEYLAVSQDMDLTVTSQFGSFTTSSSNLIDGWYAQASYRISEQLEASTYYSVSYRDSDDKDGQDALAAGSITKAFQAWHKDIALTGRYDYSDNLTIKLEGHYIDGAAFAFGTPDKRYWNLWAIKATYTF